VRLAVIGTGLIGGSIALGARGAGDMDVVGFDRDPAATGRAAELGALDRAAGSIEEAVAGADLVVLAMPLDQFDESCRAAAGHIGEDTVVTDVGSAKAHPVAVGEELFGARFVGGHPMAGSERHGIEAADASLFGDAFWILTPTPATSSDAYRRVARLVSVLGAKPIALDPVVHDALVARLSHVPQLAASALVAVAASAGDREALLGLAASGFRDVTRIAASNPDLWVAILKSNRGAVIDALEGLRGTLGTVAELIAGEHWDDLHGFLARARSARLDLFAKPVHDGEPVALSLIVPDRPGVLAEVTTAAGHIGVNIEDLRIVHSTEGGRGRVELIIAGQEPAEKLSAALHELGYSVHLGEID
jgi:prephenate dehydrogenase